MRRLLCALLALALAGPASAGRVLLIKQNVKATNQADNGIAKQLGMMEAVLRGLGVDFDEVEQTAVRSCLGCPTANDGQRAIITGVLGLNNTGATRTYAGIIHMGFTVTGGSGSLTKVTGYNPDTLTLANALGGNSSTWPSVPTLFMGIGNIPNVGLYKSTATCSTGVQGNLSAYTDNGVGVSLHMVGQPEVWNSNSHFQYSNAAALTILGSTPGITKARVVAGANSFAFRDNGASSCTDCDSVGRPATYFSSPGADTAIVWTRQRWTGDPAPLIFALPSWSNNTQIPTDAMVEAMCIAMMDSASGGQIIGQVPNWKPMKVGFVVSGAFAHSFGDVNSTGAWSTHGVYYPSDTSRVKAGIDSLASLQIPVVVTVNIDSVDSYPAEKAWWSARLPLARFSPESRVYIDSLNVNGGETNASRYLFPDVFGMYRARNIITGDRYNYGTQCDGSDTTISCLLSYMRQRLDSIPEFKGRGSATILAPWFDYFPTARNRNSLPNPDSMAVAMWRSGYQTALVGVMFPTSTPSMSWGLTAGTPPNNTTGLPTNGAGAYYPNPHTQIIHGFNGQTIGHFRWLSFRHIDEDNSNNYPGITHTIGPEIVAGLWASPWYNSDTPYWYHVMRSRLNVWVIRAGDLGWQKNATSNVTRPGYFGIKWTVNQIRAINKFAGRTVVAFAYPEDIDP